MRIPLILLVVVMCTSHIFSKDVVLYTALDRMHSEPMIQKFEEKSGINVRVVFDTEATKTTGLVNRLIAEQKKPRADVFWNNEIVRTIVLKKKGVLQPYTSPMASDIPATFKDSEGFWTGFAARARVIIANKNHFSSGNLPLSIHNFNKPEFKGKICIANPLFGTTSTHMGALFVLLGKDGLTSYLSSLKKNDIAVLAGNATTKDRVAAGIYHFGFTDTDDANLALKDKKPVAVIFPDKKDFGTLLIPNTVAMINECPHPEAAKKLIDFILSKETEAALAASSSVQIPVRKSVPGPQSLPPLSEIKAMDVDFEKVADVLEPALKIAEKILLN